MNAIIEWFNGKKTIIGTICLWVAAFIAQVALPELGLNVEFGESTISVLNWFGLAFGGVGLTHKGMKAADEADKPKKK